MTMSTCPKCGTQHSKMTTFCLACSAAFEKAVQQQTTKEASRQKRNVVIGIVAGIVLIVFFMSTTNEKENTVVQEKAIVAEYAQVQQAEQHAKKVVAADVAELKEQAHIKAKERHLQSIAYVQKMHQESYMAANIRAALRDSYVAWDNELNRIYRMFIEDLPSEEMEKIRVEQRAWVQQRDEQTNPKKVGELTQLEMLNDLTKARTLYFIDVYFNSVYTASK